MDRSQTRKKIVRRRHSANRRFIVTSRPGKRGTAAKQKTESVQEIAKTNEQPGAQPFVNFESEFDVYSQR